MQTQTIMTNSQYDTYWDDEAINELPPIIHQGQVIARVDDIDKKIYKEHYAVVYNNHMIPVKTDVKKRHNVQVMIKSNKQSVGSNSIYKPSIGFSANSPDGDPCYTYADKGYDMITKVTFYHANGELIKIYKTSLKKFKDSEYSNKFFNDYNGRVEDKTEKDTMKNMRHDHQKFVPISEMEVIETIYGIEGEFGIIL